MGRVGQGGQVGKAQSPFLPDLRDLPDLPDLTLTRRDFLSTALFAPFALQRDARFISIVPLGPPANRTPLGRLLGKGLDARLFTDLSTLGAAQSAIRNDNPRRSILRPYGVPVVGDTD